VLSDDDLVEIKGRSGGRKVLRVLGWLALVGGVGAFLVLEYWPLRQDRSRLERLQLETERSLEEARGSYFGEQEKLKGLSVERDTLAGKLEKETQEKEAALKALASIQEQLSNSFNTEIESGDIAIVRRHGQLVVDVSDKILFAQGEADVTERGQKVLGQVADVLGQLEGYTIQVAGHTDSARVTTPSLAERYPTNWELSTARATNVVRFLEETEKVASSRLMAAGFAEHRPVAANTSKYGMQRNRRIEVTLLPDPKE
jgi:chemotaxis protein MotB